MQMGTPHRRPNLSDDLAASLRREIVEGRLPAGERINEVRLAARLGVSRTPLREALARLVAEGAVRSVPRRGFFVRGLSVEELEGIYPIRALLDPEALRLAGLPSAARIERLTELNRGIPGAGDVDRTIDLDDAWHRELLAGCPNPVLLEIIEQFMARTRRYEHAYLRDRRHVETTTGEHEEILEALRAGDLDGACTALRRNLESGLRPIREWLTSRRRGDSPPTTP